MGLFSSSTKTQNEVTPLRKDQVYKWTDLYAGLMDRPFEMFPGQMYTDMDPRQLEALQMQEAYARGMGGMVDPTMQAWQSMLTAPDVASNPYVQGMLEQQSNLLNRNLQENLMPTIEGGAIGAGQLGSSRQGVAEGIAMRGTQEALANQAAQTQMDAYLAGLGQQRFGLGQAGNMAGLGMTPANILSGVGGAYRAEDQLALDEEMRRFEFEQQEPWQRLERFAGTYFPVTQPYATTTSTRETTPSGFQMAGQLAGLGMTGFGMFGGGAPGFSGSPGFGPGGYTSAAFGGYGTSPLSQQSRMLANQLWF